MINLGHLDINLANHCNYTCMDCSHASPYSRPFFMDVTSMVEDLSKLRKIAHFELVTLVGGEPLLHPKIVDFMKAAKATGISDKVCVVTNGSLLPRMKPDFWSSLEMLRISMYGKFDPKIMELAAGQAAIHGFAIHAWPYPNFFKQLKDVRDDGVKSFQSCPWKSDCYTAHLGKFYLCPQSAFYPKRFMESDHDDGLPIAGLTESELDKYLHRTEPFLACQICMAGEKKPFPWRTSERDEWIKPFRRYHPSPDEIERMSQ